MLKQKADLLAKGASATAEEKGLIERITKLIALDDELIKAEKAELEKAELEKAELDKVEEQLKKGAAAAPAGADSHAMPPNENDKSNSAGQTSTAGKAEPKEGEEDYYIVKLSKGPKFDSETGEPIEGNTFTQTYSHKEYTMLVATKRQLGYEIEVLYDPTVKQ